MEKFGLIGYPISESRSPELFREVYGDRSQYDLIDVPSFDEAWRRFTEEGYRAVNVTSPFKVLAAGRADIRSEAVERIGAANILLKMEDGIMALNSDYLAVLSIIAGLPEDIRTAAVIGCGGAGRAAAAAAEDAGLAVQALHHDEISGGVGADLVIYTCTGPVPGIERLRCKVLLEANYVSPCLADVPARYVGGLEWLRAQAKTGYGIVEKLITNKFTDMERREFLKSAATLAAVAAIAPDLGAKQSAKNGKVALTTPLKTIGTVREPAREIAVIDSADVVVLGGGPAGVSAAISAARQGADVMLLERQYQLGGLWTGGCVLPVIDVFGKGQDGSHEQAIRGFMEEITGRIASMGMLIVHKNDMPLPDPEAAKYALEQMIQESGVRMLYGCQGAGAIMSGDRIDCVIAETKSGRVAIRAKMFVDCSGDGDLMEWSGEDFEVRTNTIGAMWRIGGVRKDSQIKASRTPVEGVHYGHWGGEKDQNGLDVYNLTRLELAIRKHIWDRLEEDRKRPGCENIVVIDSGTIPGVRTTRVLNAVYNLNFEKSLKYEKYDDCVGMAGGDSTLTYCGGTMAGADRPVWQMPYRSLTPKSVQNLLVAGRCFGFEEKMTYDAREVGTCFMTGQAAGTAAGLAAASRCGVRDVDIPELQARLLKQGVRLK